MNTLYRSHGKSKNRRKKIWTIKMWCTIKYCKNFVVRVFVAFVGIFIINTKAIVCQKKWTFDEKRKIPFNAFKWYSFSLVLVYLFFGVSSTWEWIPFPFLWCDFEWKILFWQISFYFGITEKPAKCDSMNSYSIRKSQTICCFWH